MPTALARKVAEPGGDIYDAEAEQRRLLAILDARYVATLGAVHTLVQDILGLDPETFRLDDAATRRILAEAGQRVVRIDETTRKAIAEVLQEGQAAGLSDWTIANGSKTFRGIEQLFKETWAGRAETVARTEIAHAQVTSAMDRYRASGVVDSVRIVDGDGDPPCAARNGRVVPITSVVGLAHPNCLVGGQMVLAPNVLGASVRPFRGEVIVFRTAADDLLTCTPNHPILSDRGWVAAGLLREGDHVIRSLSGERVGRLLDPDHDHRPALIEQIADALGPASGGTTTTVPGAPEQFHGDGSDGDVHVVRADGRPQYRRRYVSLLEHADKGTVSLADVAAEAFAGLRFETKALPRVDRAPASSLRSSSVSGALLRSHARGASGGPGGQIDDVSIGFEPLVDGGMRSPQTGGHFVGRHAFVDIEPTQNGRARMLPPHREAARAQFAVQGGGADANAPGNLLARFAGLVAPVQVVKIERRQFSGHVYNIETAQGWYIAENIVTHNCTVTTIPQLVAGV